MDDLVHRRDVIMSLHAERPAGPGRLERTAGLVTIAALILALAVANSPLGGLYDVLHHLPLTVQAGEFGLSKPLILWVNDGLMVFFFLLVALEMKREVLDGHLSSPRLVAGPLLGAAGGVIVPALIYLAFNSSAGEAARGWPIPVATDIVLALTVLSLFSDRVPSSLKIFVAALAIFDDLVAILILAFYYTESLSTTALGIAALAILSLVVLNVAGVSRSSAYGVTGVILWLALISAGVHGTLAGVAVGFAVPFRAARTSLNALSPLSQLERQLYPWVAFGVVPAFAFFNSGIELSGETLRSLGDPMSLGIVLGLALGKPLGILGGVWLGVTVGLASLPHGTGWRHVVGGALAGGIGFTMSLFIAGLAFPDPVMFQKARLGVILGSMVSAIAATAFIRFACQPVREPGEGSEGAAPLMGELRL